MIDLPRARPPAPRKKRYCFRDGDDVLLLHTILGERSLWSLSGGQRKGVWNVITAELNALGILASAHSLRCRLKRLVENFQREIALGGRATELTELEQLLAQYTQKEAQLEQQRDDGGDPEARSRLSGGSRRSSFGTESDEGSTGTGQQLRTNTSPIQTLSASVQSTPQSEKKPRKKRFIFLNWHDVALLNAVLDDQEAVKASGAKKHDWKSITATLNSQGVNVTAHTIRTHLRLLVATYRKEARVVDSENLSEKQELLRDYCRCLDEEDQQDRASVNSQSFEPTPQSEDERTDVRPDVRTRSVRPNTVEILTEEGELRQRDLAALPVVTATGAPQTRDVVATTIHASEIAPLASQALSGAQGLPPTQIISSAQTPLGARTSVDVQTPERLIQTVTQRSPAAQLSTATQSIQTTQDVQPTQALPIVHTPPPTQAVRPVTQTPQDIRISPSTQTLLTSRAPEDEGTAPPASKKQKVDLESFLERFLSEQSERQNQEQAARISALQEQQRQTYELHKQALDMQQKTANMQ
ncbi:hypothetical protein KRP22_013446 [Phytophthora ramorum]|uniref:uncharacterized protein n=1 Tax=Phytophthora ramorum TaxID=164328 RepID=UPI0030ABE13B|nr:hypothetical protein KRP23_1819 [Phytophthora ramorum]KAH7499087.1 hypothetical protein KRP22_11385 [Phytophthora ramorum]